MSMGHSEGKNGLSFLSLKCQSSCDSTVSDLILSTRCPPAYSVVAMRSGKQTRSEGQCREWSAVYYTGGPKAESPLSQGSQPIFVKPLYTVSISGQTRLPKFPEISLNKGKERYNQS